MRFLSFSRPWLWSILELGPEWCKRIENRRWAPPMQMIGQRFALHSAKSWDDDAIGFFIRLGVTGFPNRKDLYMDSAILGVATIDRVVTEPRSLPASQQRWFFGPFGWILTDVIKLAKPIHCRGAQGLRELPTGVNAELMLQLGDGR